MSQYYPHTDQQTQQTTSQSSDMQASWNNYAKNKKTRQVRLCTIVLKAYNLNVFSLHPYRRFRFTLGMMLYWTHFLLLEPKEFLITLLAQRLPTTPFKN